MATTTLTATLFLSLVGCERDEHPGAPSKAQPSTAVSTKPTDAELANVRQFVQETERRAAGPLPAGHPPVDATAAKLPPMEGVPPAQGGLKYTAPATWPKEAVKSLLRVDQYCLPRAAGDNEDGELAVSANIGGGIEANVQRWRGQFTTADGQPVPDDAFVRETFEVDGLKVTLVDVKGRWIGAMTMEGAPAPPKDDYRMLAAIVETPGGPWYFKATGPATTIAKHRDAFLELLHSVALK